MSLSSWAAKRRLIYLLVFSTVVVIIVGIPLFNYLYRPPTCTDGMQNQDELGIDCGGSCPRLCSVDVLEPIVHWQRFFEVVPTLYSAVAYVENPNTKAGAHDVGYSFKFYDSDNILLYERKSEIDIPPRKTFAVFEHSVNILSRKPAKATFEFTSVPLWDKDFPEDPVIPVTNKDLKDESISPKLFITLENPFVHVLNDVEVTALIYDTKGNAVAVSQTVVDEIPKDGESQAAFTWPQPFPSEVRTCESSVDSILVIDRSGSMDDDGISPPQPLTEVKKAAGIFADRIRSGDQIGILSFATEASSPIDLSLTSNLDDIKVSINNIVINPNGQQYTNIADAVQKAYDELKSDNHNINSKKVVVLLTDGIANIPQKEGDGNYAETYAADVSKKIKKDGVELYTVGLGNKINTEFLKMIASGSEYYYSAPKSSDLEQVYKNISTSICKVGPAVIEIITRTGIK